MRLRAGSVLIFVACGHLVLTSIGGHANLEHMLRHGLVGTVSLTGNAQELAFLWAWIAGLGWILLGMTWNWVESKVKQPVPSHLGWVLTALGLIGGIIAPVGGFWVVAVAGLYTVWRSRS